MGSGVTSDMEIGWKEKFSVQIGYEIAGGWQRCNPQAKR